MASIVIAIVALLLLISSLGVENQEAVQEPQRRSQADKSTGKRGTPPACAAGELKITQ